MEIRITIVATYSNGLDKDLKWFDWKLFNNKGKPIAKSYMNFQQKRSAIASAKRMREFMWILSSPTDLPIYDIDKSLKKVLIK